VRDGTPRQEKRGAGDRVNSGGTTVYPVLIKDGIFYFYEREIL